MARAQPNFGGAQPNFGGAERSTARHESLSSRSERCCAAEPSDDEPPLAPFTPPPPPLLHYYLLRVPMLKFALRLASDANGELLCPRPTDDFLPCCWRAGELMRERCGDLPEDECEARVREARRLALVDRAAEAAAAAVADGAADGAADGGAEGGGGEGRAGQRRPVDERLDVRRALGRR